MRRLYKEFYTIRSTAKILEVNPLTVCYWIGLKKIKSERVAEQLVIPKEEIIEYLNNRLLSN